MQTRKFTDISANVFTAHVVMRSFVCLLVTLLPAQALVRGVFHRSCSSLDKGSENRSNAKPESPIFVFTPRN